MAHKAHLSWTFIEVPCAVNYPFAIRAGHAKTQTSSSILLI